MATGQLREGVTVLNSSIMGDAKGACVPGSTLCCLWGKSQRQRGTSGWLDCGSTNRDDQETGYDSKVACSLSAIVAFAYYAITFNIYLAIYC